MRFTKFATAEHKGGLKECLQTEEDIQPQVFEKLVAIGIYTYYGYDERIKAKRYILVNHEKNLGLPTWLHRYN